MKKSALILSLLSLIASIFACALYFIDPRAEQPAIISTAEDATIVAIKRVLPATVSISSAHQHSTAAGTGIIITSDGYILTNRHVIEKSPFVTITLLSGESFQEVPVVAEDADFDLALLKIPNATNLPTATFSQSEPILGQKVIAIGNALNQFPGSVSSGIISGLERSVTATTSNHSHSETLEHMLQTDAAISTGMSGGPLINLSSEVIGLTTATASGENGVSFAIPVSVIRQSRLFSQVQIQIP